MAAIVILESLFVVTLDGTLAGALDSFEDGFNAIHLFDAIHSVVWQNSLGFWSFRAEDGVVSFDTWDRAVQEWYARFG